MDGTFELLDRHESSANMGFIVPAMKAVINRTDSTVDSRTMADLIREQFMTMSVPNTTIKSAVAFRNAATTRVSVHRLNPRRAGDVMHQLLWELIPSVEGKHAPNHPDFRADADAASPADGSPTVPGQ